MSLRSYIAIACTLWMSVAMVAGGVAAAPRDCQLLPTSTGGAVVHPVADPGQQSGMFESMGSAMQRGMNNLGRAVTPQTRVEPAQDPISLSTPTKPSPDLLVAMAQWHQQQGDFAEATRLYQQAMKAAPKEARPVAAYAGMKAAMGDLAGATKIYQHALTLTPNDPSILNDLGLCLARQKMYNDAVASLNRAAQLQPRNVLYRNNLATVLVEMNQPEAALGQLAAVHAPAVAHYNLGYLLNKKGNTGAAIQQFTMALQRDPTMSQAQAMLQRLAAPQPAPTSSAPPPVVVQTPPPASLPTAPVPPNAPVPPSGDLRMSSRPLYSPLPPPSPTPTAPPIYTTDVPPAAPMPGASSLNRLPPVTAPPDVRRSRLEPQNALPWPNPQGQFDPLPPAAGPAPVAPEPETGGSLFRLPKP